MLALTQVNYLVNRTNFLRFIRISIYAVALGTPASTFHEGDRVAAQMSKTANSLSSTTNP